MADLIDNRRLAGNQFLARKQIKELLMLRKTNLVIQ